MKRTSAEQHPQHGQVIPIVDKTAAAAAADNEQGILARRRVEAEIIKPIYEILKRDVGTAQAQAVIGEAIRGAAIQAGQQFAAKETGGTSIGSFVALQVLWEKDDALDISVQREDALHYDYDVHRCSYAEMYHAMGLGEIGHLLSCARDAVFIEGYDPRIELTRTTTLMQGGPRCDFRYRMRTSQEAAPSDVANV